MKIKIMRINKKDFWYGSEIFYMKGKIRKIMFTKPINLKFHKDPIRYLKILLEPVDKELSGNGVEYIYSWKDIKIISLW